MERLILYSNVNNIEEYKIHDQFKCIKVTMTDDNVYYLHENIGSFQEIDKKKESTLVSTIDVFGQEICINPSYIKTIREGQCVIVDTPSGYKNYYVIGVYDTVKIVSYYCSNGYNSVSLATHIYQSSDVI